MSTTRAVATAAAALTTLTAGIVAISTSGAEAAKARCKQPAGAHTVLLSKQARVWRRRGRTYVCPAVTGRPVHLGDDHPDSSFPTSLYAHSLRLNRRYLAYAFEVSREETDLQVRVFDLRRGRFVRRIIADTQLAAPDPQAPDRITDLELAPNGSVAWVVQNARVRPPRTEVSKLDRAGRALLDAGPAIGLDSLALSAGTLYWTADGAPRSAQLQDG